jgi:hypothetical protein
VFDIINSSPNERRCDFMNNNLSNEQIAHDLAVAVVSAKISKKAYISSDISVITAYEDAYSDFLRLLNKTRKAK